MLVLTRRWGETLVVGDDIEITMLDVVDNQVRLGITAPRDVAVDREEVRLRKSAGLPPPSPAPAFAIKNCDSPDPPAARDQ